MKPLLDTHRLIIAGTALLAVIVPATLLWSQRPAIDLPARTAITPLRIVAAEPLGPAIETPLFNIGRSPLPPEPPASAVATAEAAPPAPPPVLVGTIARRRGGGLALVKNNAGETVALRVGEEVDGWRLVSVGESEAVLDQAGRRETAALDFRNKNQAAGAAPAATDQNALPSSGPAQPILTAPAQGGPTG